MFDVLWLCFRWLACFYREYKQSGVFQSPHQPVDPEGVSVREEVPPGSGGGGWEDLCVWGRGGMGQVN